MLLDDSLLKRYPLHKTKKRISLKTTPNTGALKTQKQIAAQAIDKRIKTATTGFFLMSIDSSSNLSTQIRYLHTLHNLATAHHAHSHDNHTHGEANALSKGTPESPVAFSQGTSIPRPEAQANNDAIQALANQLSIDPSDLFSGSAVITQAQPSEPLDGAPRFSVTDADPNRPGMQIDVVVSPGISAVDYEEVKNMLREDIRFREQNGWPAVEYYLYKATDRTGDNRYGGDPSGNGVNFLDFTAIEDSDPFRDGIQIDVVIDPRMSRQDRDKIYAALQEWSSAITGASGTPFEFYIWSDKSKVREQGEFLNFTLLKNNGDRNFDGRTYWNTPDQGRLIAFEPGSPLSIVLHEIGHALPLPAHTDGAMRGVNPTLNIDRETIERVLKIYDLTRRG